MMLTMMLLKAVNIQVHLIRSGTLISPSTSVCTSSSASLGWVYIFPMFTNVTFVT